jgi:phosphatidylserine/phosphatidylglycerophosphate/cardiolipin synthase-like enzyme
MMAPLAPGQTCWRVETADRVAFLVDNEAYFTALYEALQKARRSVLILGWGFDPRTRLFPDGYEGPDDPDEVGHVLRRLASERPELDVRLLIWRSALPISASQEFFPHKARGWFKDSRVDFRLDDQVPFGACHHQKLVVVDDRLAFVGGGDITVDRWDSPGHLDHDRRRIMPSFDVHPPRHEVTMMVDGAAARALADHARARWRLGTGEVLEPPPDAGGDPWPDHVPAHLIGAQVGISRTTPPWRGDPGDEEILRLTLACIARAERTIYLENQYFTSPVIAQALAARLDERDGPEIVMMMTGRSPSYFDHATMDHARGAMVWRLRAADVFGRFRAYQPKTAQGAKIIVHSKVSVFDDTVVRVGSANLNNRSFGFDTELELAIACQAEEGREQASAFLNRLIGHFLGQTGEAVARARAEGDGLIAAIDALNREGRLAPLDPSRRSALAEFIAAFHVGDPTGPADSFRLGLRRRRVIAQIRALAAPGGPAQVIPG